MMFYFLESKMVYWQYKVEDISSFICFLLYIANAVKLDVGVLKHLVQQI